jgi:hypothetical protein
MIEDEIELTGKCQDVSCPSGSSCNDSEKCPDGTDFDDFSTTIKSCYKCHKSCTICSLPGMINQS